MSEQNTPGTTADNFWKRCSTCKKAIAFGAEYYTCSVSTCSGARTGYSFCSVLCFEAHLPGARHRDAGAVSQRAPKTAAAAASPEGALAKRIFVSGGPSVSKSIPSNLPRETLIIASRLKEYITAKADYNTSASVMDTLSDYIRILCDRAIDEARADGRRTVMDRDFEFLKKS